jgi:hypothetical protein
MTSHRNDLPPLSPSARAMAGDLQRAARLLEDAEGILRRASERADDAVPDDAVPYPMVWAADVARDRLGTLAGDLREAAEGHHPPVRVEMVPIGRPEGEDSGGGFGHQALQALAVCREAWGRADDRNRPRMERAMGWIARAWLETAGYERAGVVRAVLSHGFDSGYKATIVAAVNAAAAEHPGANVLPLRAGGK